MPQKNNNFKRLILSKIDLGLMILGCSLAFSSAYFAYFMISDTPSQPLINELSYFKHFAEQSPRPTNTSAPIDYAPVASIPRSQGKPYIITPDSFNISNVNDANIGDSESLTSSPPPKPPARLLRPQLLAPRGSLP
jgi:hypothetical protein